MNPFITVEQEVKFSLNSFYSHVATLTHQAIKRYLENYEEREDTGGVG